MTKHYYGSDLWHHVEHDLLSNPHLLEYEAVLHNKMGQQVSFSFDIDIGCGTIAEIRFKTMLQSRNNLKFKLTQRMARCSDRKLLPRFAEVTTPLAGLPYCLSCDGQGLELRIDDYTDDLTLLRSLYACFTDVMRLLSNTEVSHLCAG